MLVVKCGYTLVMEYGLCATMGHAWLRPQVEDMRHKLQADLEAAQAAAKAERAAADRWAAGSRVLGQGLRCDSVATSS